MQIFLIVIFTANIFILNANPTPSKNKKYIVEVGNSSANDKMEETTNEVAVTNDDDVVAAVPNADGVDAVPVDDGVDAVTNHDGVDAVPNDEEVDAVTDDDGVAAVTDDDRVAGCCGRGHHCCCHFGFHV